MDRDTVTQIKIGTHRFGIVGLKKVLKNMAETYADQIAEFKVKGTPALIIDGKEMTVCAGQVVVMPANVPHSVTGVKRFKMLLTVVKNT